MLYLNILMNVGLDKCGCAVFGLAYWGCTISWLQARVGLVTMADTPHLQWHLGTYSTTRANLDAVAELCYTDGALNITAAIEWVYKSQVFRSWFLYELFTLILKALHHCLYSITMTTSYMDAPSINKTITVYRHILKKYKDCNYSTTSLNTIILHGQNASPQ